MRRVHLIVGILGVIAFVLTGQVMKHHHPPVKQLAPEVRMMYVSRHIYLLGASLVNVTLGLYLHVRPEAWRRILQWTGSLLILFAPIVLTLAFVAEPAMGLAGRGRRSYYGMIGLFFGVMMLMVASLGAESGRGAN